MLALIASGQGADADPAIIDDLLLERVAEPGAEGRGLAHRRSRPRRPARGAVRTERRRPARRRHDPHRPVRRLVRRPTRRACRWQSLADNPHGVDLGPLQPRFPAALRTVSGTIELASEPIANDIERSVSSLDGPPRRPDRARRSSPSAIEQLVDAQRQRVGEGQGPLHVAGASRRRTATRPHRRCVGQRGVAASAPWSHRSKSPTRSGRASSAFPTVGVMTGPARRWASPPPTPE